MSLTDEPLDNASTAPADDSDLHATDDENKYEPHPELAEWIMEKVVRWRQSRNNNYGSHWEKYYRIWRGIWSNELKQKLAERSRIITPATQNAVDQTVAEMAEAVFGRGMWFDLSEQAPPPQPTPPPAPGAAPHAPAQEQPESEEDIERERDEQIRDNLIEDFNNSRLVADVIETFYNGAVYGEGIAKRVQETRLDGSKFISWEPVNPNGFVIDTAATTIDEALGVAHETIRPSHEIQEKMESKEYFECDVGTSAAGFGTTDLMKGGLTDFLEIDPQDGVYITEWHGKVPARFMKGSTKSDPDSDLLAKSESDAPDDEDEEKYVEAIVVIGNATHVLKAEINALNDRGFIAYQHHRNPNSFWGIGVAEKAFNSQIGLDGEVRMRQDSLALTTYPTVGVDATRMPRNLNMVVGPGKVYLTNGRPSEIIEAIKFGNLDGSSFQQSGDMERYVQMATGANDPAKPVNANSTATGQSVQSSAFIKRAKLTMQSVDTDFLGPMIRKSLLAYSVIDPARYPKLPSFSVNSTMSIMAREFEQMQMTNLLAVVPQQSPAFPIILKGIIENYSGPSKDKIIEAIEQSMKPDPQQTQFAQQQQTLTIAKLQAEVQKVQSEIKEIEARSGLAGAKTADTQMKTKLAPIQTRIQARQTDISAKTADTQHRQVEVTAAQAQLDHHHRTQDRMHDSAHKRMANLVALRKVNQPPATAGQGE
jgi:hypothetical protein